VTAVTEALPEARLVGECSPPHRTGATRRTARGYASGKEDYLRRLRKVEGQVRGPQKMIEAGTWCPDVVTQVASATRALQEVAVGLLNDHLRHCVSSAAGRSGADGDQMLAEVAGAIRQVVRL
jgi:DNA-binding FrmR family transcriptional regulator